jgi:hypothetical protein
MTKVYKTPASAFGGATWWRQHCGGGPPRKVQAGRWGKRMTCTDCEPAEVAWQDEPPLRVVVPRRKVLVLDLRGAIKIVSEEAA